MAERRHPRRPARQRGAALLILLVLVVMAGLSYLVAGISPEAANAGRERRTQEAMAQAREALIGYSVSEASILNAGYLPVPDAGWTTTPEGNSEGTLGATDISVIGKLPWKTLGYPPLRDGQGECFWYVVSGRFKNSPKTSVFNWDTPGQIDVIDVGGNPIAYNVAALIVAPGAVLDSQSRAIADSAALIHCGGNYDARNYLDSYNGSDAVSGEVNYFGGSTNNRVAPNTDNKRFVLAKNAYYNDRFLFVTADDIYRPIIRRGDFAAQIGSLLDDGDFRLQVEPGHPETIAVSGSGTKGADNINCNNLGNANNRTFCNNWKEMLLLTQLSAPSPITVDGVPTVPCARVLIFGGRKTANQVRSTSGEKSDKNNYLEAPNLDSFAVPTTSSHNFDGKSQFDPANPGADIIRCIS